MFQGSNQPSFKNRVAAYFDTNSTITFENALSILEGGVEGVDKGIAAYALAEIDLSSLPKDDARRVTRLLLASATQPSGAFYPVAQEASYATLSKLMQDIQDADHLRELIELSCSSFNPEFEKHKMLRKVAAEFYKQLAEQIVHSTSFIPEMVTVLSATSAVSSGESRFPSQGKATPIHSSLALAAMLTNQSEDLEVRFLALEALRTSRDVFDEVLDRLSLAWLIPNNPPEIRMRALEVAALCCPPSERLLHKFSGVLGDKNPYVAGLAKDFISSFGSQALGTLLGNLENRQLESNVLIRSCAALRQIALEDRRTEEPRLIRALFRIARDPFTFEEGICAMRTIGTFKGSNLALKALSELSEWHLNSRSFNQPWSSDFGRDTRYGTALIRALGRLHTVDSVQSIEQFIRHTPDTQVFKIGLSELEGIFSSKGDIKVRVEAAQALVGLQADPRLSAEDKHQILKRVVDVVTKLRSNVAPYQLELGTLLQIGSTLRSTAREYGPDTVNNPIFQTGLQALLNGLKHPQPEIKLGAEKKLSQILACMPDVALCKMIFDLAEDSKRPLFETFLLWAAHTHPERLAPLKAGIRQMAEAHLQRPEIAMCAIKIRAHIRGEGMHLVPQLTNELFDHNKKISSEAVTLLSLIPEGRPVLIDALKQAESHSRLLLTIPSALVRAAQDAIKIGNINQAKEISSALRAKFNELDQPWMKDESARPLTVVAQAIDALSYP